MHILDAFAHRARAHKRPPSSSSSGSVAAGAAGMDSPLPARAGSSVDSASRSASPAPFSFSSVSIKSPQPSVGDRQQADRERVQAAAAAAAASASSSSSSSSSSSACSSFPSTPQSSDFSLSQSQSQFSRKKGRHVPLDSKSHSLTGSASSSSFSSSSSSSHLIGNRKPPSSQPGSSSISSSSSSSSTSYTDVLSAREEERRRVLDATLSSGQQQVVQAVRAGRSVFFTGSAGTGKSFLLNYLRHSLPPATTFFTASTGLAAVNISGTTLHSFAGVGLGVGTPEELLERVQAQQAARKRWQHCRCLVVDEVSMIDAALFNKLEYIARRLKRDALPFGGVQLVLSGDFLQLPPVGKGCAFCFESERWPDCIQCVIELDSVFRQADSSLVSILNGVRRGIIDSRAMTAFTACIDRQFDTSDGIVATKLYAMKAQVHDENVERLQQLDTPAVTFTSLDSGSAAYIEQLKRSCHAVDRLVLKVGAQVMLIKNLTTERGLVNGSRGVVLSFQALGAVDEMPAAWRKIQPAGVWPLVRFTNGAEVVLTPEKWSADSRIADVEVQRRSVASREQVPLMLAWSLTVHKCQGLTLDRVCLQLGSVFEHGQAYVALSRIRALDCLSIEKSFPKHLVKAHPTALAFYDRLGTQKQQERRGRKPDDDDGDAMRTSQPTQSSAAVPSAAQDAEQWEEDWMVAQAENQPPTGQHGNSSAVNTSSSSCSSGGGAPLSSSASSSSSDFVRASALSLSEAFKVRASPPQVNSGSSLQQQLHFPPPAGARTEQRRSSAITDKKRNREVIDLLSEDDGDGDVRMREEQQQQQQDDAPPPLQQPEPQQQAPTSPLPPQPPQAPDSAPVNPFAVSPYAPPLPASPVSPHAQPSSPSSFPSSSAAAAVGDKRKRTTDSSPLLRSQPQPPPPPPQLPRYASQPLFHSAVCSQHGQPLVEEADGRDSKAMVKQEHRLTKVEARGEAVKQEAETAVAQQWLYVCSAGCRLTVRRD